jgi:hypothetical protein
VYFRLAALRRDARIDPLVGIVVHRPEDGVWQHPVAWTDICVVWLGQVPAPHPLGPTGHRRIRHPIANAI